MIPQTYDDAFYVLSLKSLNVDPTKIKSLNVQQVFKEESNISNEITEEITKSPLSKNSMSLFHATQKKKIFNYAIVQIKFYLTKK